ncbi:MAG: RNB domain-containing ribonuclease [Helicobacteraceae bacterium]|nr:RNB domain-containing ribonuclease [Helicobacteraceae bacterium]
MKTLLIKLTLGLYEQDISKDEREHVNSLFEEGFITYEKNIYTLPSKYRAGTLSVSQDNSAYLQIIGATAVRDLYIDTNDMHGATQGDIVIAQRLLGGRGRPSAKIVKVVGREQSYSIAIVKIHENEKVVVSIKTSYNIGVPISQKEIDTYEVGTLFKINNENNTIEEVLGNISDPLVDEKIVLSAYNKHDEFEPDVLAMASEFNEVDASKYSDRRDLRSLPFCTIDPVTAKDFDDAIYYDESNSTIYVAIADVSEYVKPFGAIDVEAIYRSFSIYLPHRSIPMLPRTLSETLCSLQPHVDRLAYVFEMKLEELEVVEATVYEAIIHSSRRFTYEDVDAFFEGKLKPKNDEEREVFAYLRPLKKVTDALREKRLKIGFDFRSDEIEMSLNEAGLIQATTIADDTPSHSLVEDCMLLANKAAASKFERGVFRIHEPPSQSKIQTLYQELAGIGMMIEPKESLKETITYIQREAERLNILSDVDKLIIQSQMRARYAPDNVGHFGLGFEAYSHFTSPIRRYSDLIIHRLLKAINSNDTEEGSYVLRNIDALCVIISEKEREAGSIELDFMQRKFARWADENIGKTFKARVIKTEDEIFAETTEGIIGARLHIVSTIPILLFDELIVRLETSDIATAKITATVEEKAE